MITSLLLASSQVTLICPSKSVSVEPGTGGPAAAPRPLGAAPPAPPVPPRMLFSVPESSLQPACWSGRTWISPSPDCGTSTLFNMERTRR